MRTDSPPPRQSPFGLKPPADVRSPRAIVRIDRLSDGEARALREHGTAPVALLDLRAGTWLAVAECEPGEVEDSITTVVGAGAVCTDLTQARVVLRVSGANARARLARGCPLDLDAIAPGEAAATLLGAFEVVIWRSADLADTWDVLVARSFARSARDWLYELESPPAG